MLAGLASGVGVGLFNGIMVAELKINSLIATLATMQIVRGLAFLVSGGEAVAIPEESFYVLGSGAFLRRRLSGLDHASVLFVFGIVLNATVFGRNVLAIGGNAEAARFAGVPIDRVKIIVFTCMAQ